MSEPRTDAGRGLVRGFAGSGDEPRVLATVLAIEAEALDAYLASHEADEEVARALRAYVGHRRTPQNPDGETWYIDIDSGASDAEIAGIAAAILTELRKVRAGE